MKFRLSLNSYKSGNDSSICRNGINLPWEKFTACFHGIYRCMLDTAAAGNFHAYDGYAFDIILADDLGQLFTVIDSVKLRASDERDLAAHEFLMHVRRGVRRAVRRVRPPA